MRSTVEIDPGTPPPPKYPKLEFPVAAKPFDLPTLKGLLSSAFEVSFE